MKEPGVENSGLLNWHKETQSSEEVLECVSEHVPEVVATSSSRLRGADEYTGGGGGEGDITETFQLDQGRGASVAVANVPDVGAGDGVGEGGNVAVANVESTSNASPVGVMPTVLTRGRGLLRRRGSSMFSAAVLSRRGGNRKLLAIAKAK